MTPPPAPRVDKPVASGEGYMRINSKPATKIAIDGKDTGLWTPQLHLRLNSGMHRVTLSNPQFVLSESYNIEVKPGETQTVVKDLRPKGGEEE